VKGAHETCQPEDCATHHPVLALQFVQLPRGEPAREYCPAGQALARVDIEFRLQVNPDTQSLTVRPQSLKVTSREARLPSEASHGGSSPDKAVSQVSRLTSPGRDVTTMPCASVPDNWELEDTASLVRVLRPLQKGARQGSS
jgi:hypothetical protein